MSLISVLALAVTVVGLVYLWATRNTNQAEAAYQKAELIRQISGAIFVTISVYTFFQSGDPVLITAGIIGLAFVTLYILIEKPHKEVA